MRKHIFVIFLIGLTFLFLYNFFKVKVVDFSAVYKIESLKTEFYPDAYVFFNSIEDFCAYGRVTKRSELVDSIMEANSFDFSKYTYLIVYGAKIKRMYYSSKSTFFNDPSPEYGKALRFFKDYLEIDYYQPDSAIYIYRIDHNEKLTGSCD